MSGVVDSPQRLEAIDPLRSFCVTAPAGSGKTELLIQRYLGLLARVQRPEQVLAITFTRKAAAEMRERVLLALEGALRGLPCDSEHQQLTRSLAGAALAADKAGGWQLLHNVSRLNIKTIDSFCAGLTRQMPVLSHFGGQASPQDDEQPLYEEAVTELFGLLNSGHAVVADLRALLTHFDNRWQRLRDLLVSMLGRRDQWSMYIGVHEAPEESEAYLVQVVEELVAVHLRETQQLLLPYREIIVELQRFAAGNLEAQKLEGFPGSAAADLPSWRLVVDLLLTKGRNGKWREAKGINVRCGFPADKSGVPKQRKDQVIALLDELRSIPGLLDRLAGVRILPEVRVGSEGWEMALTLSRLLPVLQAQLLLVFSRHGAVDYSQLSQSALQALGPEEEPTDLALRMDYSIEHILVDEFQDTSSNQYYLLHRLTRGWGEHNAANPGAPRTLLVVGDAMQSIYGFRDANVGLFFQARERGFNDVSLEHLALQCNFRSDEGLVNWFNTTFGRHFPELDDISTGRVSYSPATAVRDPEASRPVTLDAFRGEGAADAEVAFICAAITQQVAAGERDIAVLGRQRNHLRPILRRLKELGVPCQAAELDRLDNSPVAADLLSLCRALANDADEVAWMALLRAPWCGLSLEDLLRVACRGQAAAGEPLRRVIGDGALQHSLSEEGRPRLARLAAIVDKAFSLRDRLGLRVWIEQVWLELGGPDCVPGPLALEDAESFLRLLEQAESEGIGLDVQWLQRQVHRKYMSGGDGDCPVQLLTLHKAKGLEFDRVYIPCLDGVSPSDTGELLRWDEQVGADGQPVFLLAANDRSAPGEPTLYRYLGERRREKERNESTRLLYVGATRAIRHLHLSGSVKWDDKRDEPKKPSSCLMQTIWETFGEQCRVHDAPGAPVVTQVRAPQLQRLSRSSLPDDVAEPRRDYPQQNVPDRPDNHFERAMGTVVHLALEELSQGTSLPRTFSEDDAQRWQRALRMEGLAGEPLKDALELVLASVRRALDSEGRGRWVLSPDHAQARSEWRLQMLDEQGVPRSIVIDRSFIDAASGERWIVDYKTSRPVEGEELPAFLERETQHYREQLQRYRDAVVTLGPQPLRCALLFTALGHFYEITELALPAR